VVGSTIIETPSPMRARNFETTASPAHRGRPAPPGRGERLAEGAFATALALMTVATMAVIAA
jgi:hypothetical protein